MGKYLKISILLLLSIAIHFNMVAKNTIDPDFAFPQKVSLQAEEDLKRALKDNNGNAVVRSLIDYSIAQSLINTDSIQSIINKIEQVAVKEKNPCTKALLNTLLCQIYSSLYSSDALTIERRANINAGTPLDIAEWSKKNFENKVFELCDAALTDADALKKAKLSDYRDIIKQNSLTLIYYPTLYDFVASSLIEYIHELSLIGIKNNILPLNEFLTTPISNTDQYTQRIYSIYKDVESFHKNDIAPLIYWDLMRIDNSYDSNFALLRDNYSHLEQRDKAIQYLYDTYSHSEYASLVLIYQWEESYRNANAPTKLKFYNLLKKRLSQFPAYSGNCDIQNILNHIEQQKLSFRHNQLIAPNDTLSIYISNTNCSSLKVEILRLPDDIGGRSYYSFKKGETPQIYKSFDLSYRNEIPFFLEDTLKTTITQPGYYSVIAYNDKIKKDLNNLEVLYCSELTSISANRFKEDYRIWVVNAKTGKVVNNADINIFERSDMVAKGKPMLSTKSSKTGIINLKPNNNNDLYYYTMSKGDDKYAPQDYFYISNIDSDTTWTDRATCFTSLSLYHQGDIVDWSAVIYRTKGESQELATNKTYTISFRDANYMQIDTAIVTTDNWGRVEGKFTIPTDRLTGKYSITITGKFNHRVAGTSFMVSDYKLPTFDVKISDIIKQENDNYLISGEVRTFSGFALSDATIALDLKSREYQFFNPSPFSSILNDSTTTDANGKFSFSIALPIINAGDKAIYNAEIVATAPNGESHETSRIFTNGNSFYINAFGLENTPIEVTKNTKLNVELNSISKSSTEGTIYYSIINNNENVVKSGSFSSTNAVVDWSNIASGEYEIKLHSVAPTATDTITADIRLYRLSDALPPIDQGIWIQNKKYTITKDNSVEFYYGSTLDDGEILYVLYDDKKIYDQRWIKTKAGIHKSRILLPKDVNEATVNLIAVNDYNCYIASAKINRANAYNGIKINAQSFRDKITPGSEEQWTFSITDTKGKGKESAIIMDMYSIAIEKLNPHNFHLQFYKPSYYANINMPYFDNNSQYRQSSLSSNGNCIDMKIPQFNTYNYSLINTDSRYDNIIVRAYSSKRLANSLSGKVAGYAIVEEEAELSDDVVMYEVEEPKNQNQSAEVIDVTNMPNIALRENETPLAFFRPMLTTDTLGNLSYSFTVPNANTTWLFNAIAYDNNMDVAHFARNVIANKPIMVQPNVPRFLRNSDMTTIKASVMNNSDSTLVVTTIIEIFDPSTAKNITQYRQIDTIRVSQSAIASVDIKAPINATMIGYRIKSYCDNFGDGEQSIIPILPATSPVIESTTFYMGADQKSYALTLPSMPAEARVTLEFCENPTWYAVTALPGLNNGQSRTSTSATMAIYSASIADGILRQNPQIASALYQWQHSDKTDSTLVSMLSRNQDLKNMLLSATPWVEDANNDTERMARLSLLFNKKEIKATIDKNIHLLATLQRSGGGWAWIAENDKASTWATLSILEKIGHMKKLGFLPDNKDLNSMIENAIKYVDAEYAQLFKKYPKSDYSTYVFIRDMFPEYRQSTAAKKVSNATIQLIVSNWKQYSLAKKATSAIILYNNGYNSSAREILNSITEFSQSTTSQGMWWPTVVNNLDHNIDKNLVHANILDAYYQITPNNRDIDKMRQWLIINKEANDWGNSFATSYVIYTLLNTGTRWTKPAVGCEISLNGEQITPTHFETITGYLRTDISSLSPSGKKLTVAKHGQSPSWGAVYRQYNADMSSIEAVAGNDISINKTLLKKQGNSWVETADYNVGDIVKVQLTIKTYRDIEYVTITDERAACFEPTEQLPRPIYAEGIYFYRENRDDATNIFVNNLPKGTYLLTYDMYVNNEGKFASGIATIQSQYAPQITAHSAGNLLNISAQ